MEIIKVIFPALLAAFAAIIVAIIGAYFALKNIKTNNVINARINWLNQLKGYIADFISKQFTLLRITDELSTLTTAQLDPKETEVDNLNKRIMTKFDEYHYLTSELNKIQTLIFLNLNSDEKLHAKLETVVKDSQGIKSKIEEVLNALLENTKNQYHLHINQNKVSEKLVKEKIDIDRVLYKERLNFNSNANYILDISKTVIKIEWEKCKSGHITPWRKSKLRSLEFNKYIKSLG